MRIIEPGYEIMRPQKLDRDSRNAILSIIEAVGRTCYKSEDRISRYMMMDVADTLKILPPTAAVCPVCADRHDTALPHNRNSLYYHMVYYRRTGTFPSWRDAMSHCSESVQAAWTKKLKESGISIDER